MKITTIDIAKGESFKTCIWKEASKEQERKFSEMLNKIKK
jgi:hypothetical protein|tara:strand:- start:248 stop:367 length:120 start_codon:yes stop_codon:yes gene_type:complete